MLSKLPRHLLAIAVRLHVIIHDTLLASGEDWRAQMLMTSQITWGNLLSHQWMAQPPMDVTIHNSIHKYKNKIICKVVLFLKSGQFETKTQN